MILYSSWLYTDCRHQVLSLGVFNRTISNEDHLLNSQTESVGQLHCYLSESLKLRILNVPPPPSHDGGKVRIAILFSGGLDCSVLARMAHDILPSEQEIDLLNVGFENPRVVQAAAKNATKINPKARSNQSDSKQILAVEDEPVSELSPYEKCPDRETGRKAFEELKRVCPGRIWRFVAVSTSTTLWGIMLNNKM
jgi:asparagine synthetase B (glutamine-hydrolysing)